MIDKKLYCETFSRLHASEEAKKEVFQMTKKKGARIPKLLRGAAIAAAMSHQGMRVSISPCLDELEQELRELPHIQIVGA